MTDSRPPAPMRNEFPLLARNPGLIYLDNAATTQKPACVLDAEREFYETANANVHRASHRLAVAATGAFESARATVAHFLNATTPNEVVFTRGTTEAINLVARSWGQASLRPGDEIVLTELEHHANIVPWQFVAQATCATIRAARIARDGTLDMEHFHSLLSPRTRLVGCTLASNAIGTMPPIAEIVAAAHAHGARVLVDAAQAVAHQPVDVQALGADFCVFSGHKVYGPTGIGALWAREDILQAMPPWQGGGEMIDRVSFAGSTFAPAPARFEAGTPPIAQAVGLAAALEWLIQQDRAALLAHENALRIRLENGLKHMPGVQIVGPNTDKAPLTALRFAHAHPFDVAQFLDNHDIAVRVGQHCAQPLLQALGESSLLRVSFAAYNTEDEIDRFLAALEETLELLA
ncbi:cysteine sulfinate desulfinase [Formivibrio citricus]|uniref:Probable cysteine desulfurase n=1 Tax=Formivibrio citricus TaxID=83765 RepID=A0A1I4XDJ3_9NEIS|nr:cysteine desulfurase [Formivibrio citricus]SFN24001.1 cysteine sulfinate desulfinase [Formivibrio citricus]